MRILVMMAALPALVLLAYVWRMDPVEKEPSSLLAKLLICGMLSTIPAVLIEVFGTGYLLDGQEPYDLESLILDNFGIVAVTEECCKYAFLRHETWRNRNFDYVFDGIVYAVFVGLGFAIAENITYVFSYGPDAAVTRAFTAIPGHAVFAVFMGHFYGRAKLAQVQERHVAQLWNGIWAILAPILCHGTYDTLASLGGYESVFFLFLLVMVAIAMAVTKHVARREERISEWY